MQAHLNESLRLDHELARQTQHEVGAITTLLFLHFCGLGYHFCSGVMNIALLDDGSSVRCNEKAVEVVDNHLVHTCVNRRYD